MSGEPITSDQAVAKARAVGESAYGAIDMFEVSVQEDPGSWIVNFTNPRAMSDGAESHFAVWVNKQSGETQLFRGR
jgi:hypothetical protein